MNDTEKTDAVRSYARECNGSERFFAHSLCPRLLYSEGVHHLAETCGAFWLIDIVASYVTAKRLRLEDHPFQAWKLVPIGERGIAVRCEDGNNGLILSQLVELSDFPRELLPFMLLCEQGGDRFVLMLPEER